MYRSAILFVSALILLALLTPAMATSLDRWPVKPRSSFIYPGPTGERNGGDTTADAVPVDALPFVDSGNTCSANDDYDDACYQYSVAPDVVYSFTPESALFVDIDLCGSTYDTKVFVLDGDLNPIACSDDTYYTVGHPCGRFNAKLEFLALEGGQSYYIVVDGWGGECGDYELAITENSPCTVPCPGAAYLETEPPMQGAYDSFNAGCYSDWSAPLDYILPLPGQGIPAMICGFNGYYDIPDGMGYDHDWWEVVVGTDGAVTVTLLAQRTTNLLQLDLAGGDCNQATVMQETYNEPCEQTSLTMVGEPGSVLYFWVHTIYNEYPNGEYPYYLEVYGGTVVAERHSLSGVKAMYR